MIEQSVYATIENVAPCLTLWVAGFYLLSLGRIAYSKRTNNREMGYGSVISELPGLPLVFMHSVAFYEALKVHDWLSAFLFAWWGPGFFIFAAVYLYGKAFQKNINWAPYGLITSYACKIDYVIFMGIYWYFDMPITMYVFSVWIICDQINLAYFLGTGDRTRRTFEDFWILRMMYPGFLFIPFFYTDIPHVLYYQIFGVALFVTWLWALYDLYQRGLFFVRYKNIDYLRNIVYLSKRYRRKDLVKVEKL